MRNIQKLQWLLVFSLSASLYAADWTGATSEPESTKKIDGKVYYVITSAEELAWFAEQVNGGESEINAMLANDIQFMDDTSKTSTVNWTPIGKEYSVIFKGVFDGAGYSIFGLYCKQDMFAGIFGTTDETAVIKGLKSKKSSINGGSLAGGIVAENHGTVLDCANSGMVSSVSGVFATSGGIV